MVACTAVKNCSHNKHTHSRDMARTVPLKTGIPKQAASAPGGTSVVAKGVEGKIVTQSNLKKWKLKFDKKNISICRVSYNTTPQVVIKTVLKLLCEHRS